ncbi:MAG TPA: UDP-N-acetylmuramate dehydrogenase [Terriglobales bacterium]|jgi:UDP-N-acetylmuramate dehydrogenase|nr:UDP-N-acetylmuramate dehydrogenase [Terriglobales bacterium]
MKILENVPLAPLSTFKVGGAARYFAEPRTAAEVSEAVQFAGAHALSLFVLGGGSNLVISDAGWPGLVLKPGISGIDERQQDGKSVFEVGAGEEWDRFVARAVARNCAGVECLSGIPGSVGGTPVQNVGAYGQEVAETIDSVLALDLRDGQLHELCAEACGFRYRTSIFNTSERGRYIILRVTYTLTPGGEPRIQYTDLKRHFAGWQETPTLMDTREAVRRIRATKAMLITPGDEDCRSAGSFFKNPVLAAAQYQELTGRAQRKGLQIPSFPALDAQHKVSAAWLVEHSGFSKGYGSGRVGISRKHALAIVNRGEATAADILALKDHIQQRVEELWGIHLEPEPVFVGF